MASAIVGGLLVVAAHEVIDRVEHMRLDNQLAVLGGARSGPFRWFAQSTRARELLQAQRRRAPLAHLVTTIPHAPSAAVGRPPILLIPGLGGSPLWYRDAEDARWEALWVSLDVFAPKGQGNTEIWKRRMRARYDVALDDWVPEYPDMGEVEAWRASNYREDGSFVVTDDVGGTAGCSNIVFHPLVWTPGMLGSTTGFRPVIETLQHEGWCVGTTLFGIGYDFRKITGRITWSHFVQRLHDLLRAARVMNGGQKIHVITHSLGGPVFRAAVRTNPDIANHIALWCPMVAPWGGSTRSIQAILLGSTFGLAPIGPSGQAAWFQNLQHNCSALLATLPRASVYTGVVAEIQWDTEDEDGTEEKGVTRYTADDASLLQLLRDTGNDNAALAYQHSVAPWRHLAFGDLGADNTPERIIPTKPILSHWHHASEDSEAEWVPIQREKSLASTYRFVPRQRINPFAPPESFAARYHIHDIRPDRGDGAERSPLSRAAVHYLHHGPGEMREGHWRDDHLVVEDKLAQDGRRPTSDPDPVWHGDGTVPGHSLALASALGPPVILRNPELNHSAILQYPPVHATLMRLVRGHT